MVLASFFFSSHVDFRGNTRHPALFHVREQLIVVDEQNVMLGIVTVDDILDILMPERGKLDTYSWFALSKMAGRGR